jgi:hypothetical protein
LALVGIGRQFKAFTIPASRSAQSGLVHFTAFPLGKAYLNCTSSCN